MELIILSIKFVILANYIGPDCRFRDPIVILQLVNERGTIPVLGIFNNGVDSFPAGESIHHKNVGGLYSGQLPDRFKAQFSPDNDLCFNSQLEADLFIKDNYP